MTLQYSTSGDNIRRECWRCCSYLGKAERAELTLVGLLSGMDSKMFCQS